MTALRISADQTITLDGPCPHCTGEAGHKMRQANAEEVNAWHDRESSAFQVWVAARDAAGHMYAWDPDLWRTTAEYQALGPVPSDVAETGCVECDWTGKQLTPAGRDLLAFVRRHTQEG
jgi:hypothetical protein